MVDCFHLSKLRLKSQIQMCRAQHVILIFHNCDCTWFPAVQLREGYSVNADDLKGRRGCDSNSIRTAFIRHGCSVVMVPAAHFLSKGCQLIHLACAGGAAVQLVKRHCICIHLPYSTGNRLHTAAVIFAECSYIVLNESILLHWLAGCQADCHQHCRNN